MHTMHFYVSHYFSEIDYLNIFPISFRSSLKEVGNIVVRTRAAFARNLRVIMPTGNMDELPSDLRDPARVFGVGTF
ncbi:Lon proteolytic domain-containing protein [Caenorhabditis elegans]|uniref:Lon proteolytic domain-containing protein n=2 Tax=Caenorhabditis elegans TaxID=6239 RepID=A0A061AEB7_CAEEL|nr:Lon proteolytic domain-containing protein [Caenorhabditis elegans]CDR32804.1 Lon proteolytic domain-containing protein [Caenorhabditis elegans]|eukprot:NP_001293316.1 Uncharacterized protein CELE_F23C8.14 [Caenorhabditis elegans]